MLPHVLVATRQPEICLCARLLLSRRAYSGDAKISSHGRIRDAKGLASYGNLDSSGYRRVLIDKQSYAVHRLVAAAFLGPAPDPTCWQVNHLDGDPANNHVSNLQYVTAAENMKHAWATSRSRQSVASKLGTPVHYRRFGQAAWNFCLSQRAAVRMLGVRFGTISSCCRGQTRMSKGNDGWYEFRWAAHPYDGMLQLNEIWRPALYPGDRDPQIENLLVSNRGRISQLTNGRNMISCGSLLKTGYLGVTKRGRGLLMHRLVAATFLGQPNLPTLQVNHKDGDRLNNHVRNLEYVTPSENARHSWQRIGDARNAGRATPVLARPREDGGCWQEFRSVKAAASHTGVDRKEIASIYKGATSAASWDFRLATEELLPDEQWRPLVLEGVRRR